MSINATPSPFSPSSIKNSIESSDPETSVISTSMGFSLSKPRRDHHHTPLVEPQSPNPIPSVSLPPPPPPRLLPAPEISPPSSIPPPPQQHQQIPTITRPPQQHQLPALPPPQPPSTYPYAANSPYPSPPVPPRPSYYQYPPRPSYPPYQPPPNPYSYPPPYTSQPPHYSHYAGYYNNGWGQGCPPAAATTSAAAPPPYVDHKTAKKIKNDVNVHKDTIKLTVDEQGAGSHLVSFTFDALVDGRVMHDPLMANNCATAFKLSIVGVYHSLSITILYFAKEDANCTFSPIYPDVYKPIKIPFQKGSGQKFHQPHGTGMDLGFFDNEELSKPSQNEEVFPLVIYAETTVSAVSSHAQITQAVLEKDKEGQFRVRVVKQILWIDGVRYELREIYGISNADDKGFEDSDPGKECVICMTDPKDTAVLPCRHMCMCSGCAKELRLQSNKCPICRQPIEELLEIKVNNASS